MLILLLVSMNREGTLNKLYLYHTRVSCFSQWMQFQSGGRAMIPPRERESIISPRCAEEIFTYLEQETEVNFGPQKITKNTSKTKYTNNKQTRWNYKTRKTEITG